MTPNKQPYEKLPPGALFHFWHPEREGVEPCDERWTRELSLIHPGLRAVRPPAGAPEPCDRRWIIWQRDPTMLNPLCVGWKLLFLWPPKDYAPIPLDNRVLANLAIIDPRRYASGLQYFDTIVAQLNADKETKAKANRAYLADHVREFFESRKIKNIGAGSKFARHHDGTVVESRGEANWVRERGDKDLPSSIAKERKERGKR